MHNHRLRTLRIAVADDEPGLLRYYQFLLPRFGHEVVSVGKDGQELLEHCQTYNPDLVITDIRMPNLDGLDAVCQIDMPFIIVSGQDEPDRIDSVFGNRCVSWLTKPIKQDDLKQALDTALSQIEVAAAPASDSSQR